MDQKDKEQIVYWMDQAAANLGRESEKTLEYCSRIFSYAESCGEDLDMYLGFAHYYSGEAYYTLNNVEMVLYHASTDVEQRDRCIADIQERLDHQIRIMDYFEDFYEYAGLLLNIDYFKQYNDNYGHQKGDRCICLIADQLKRIAQYQGVSVYRYGGDEFVVIYEGLTRERVAEIAEELREHVWAEHVEHVYSKAADIVMISQGICWGYPAEGQAPADYLHAADEKLYEVKEQCRGGMLLADFCVQ